MRKKDKQVKNRFKEMSRTKKNYNFQVTKLKHLHYWARKLCAKTVCEVFK